MPSSRRSEPLAFTGRHLFITGGTGFLGRSLLDYLGESAARHGGDFAATVLTRRPQQFLSDFPGYAEHGWLRFVEGDLDALPDVAERFTDVVHAAADTHGREDRIDWLDQLIGGTRRVLDYARGHQVSRLLYVSSGAVYGAQPAGQPRLPEDWPLAPLPTDPTSVYGTGKRLAEHLCALYVQQYGLPCVIARCFAILSEHMPLDGPYAAGNFLRDALSRDVIRVRGDGRALRTYIDGRDAAHWLFTLLERGAAGEAYNVGSDEAMSVLQLAQRIGAQLAPGKPVVVEDVDRGGPRSIYVPDVGKCRSLGLTIETNFTDAIASAVPGDRRSSGV